MHQWRLHGSSPGGTALEIQPWCAAHKVKDWAVFVYAQPGQDRQESGAWPLGAA